jgi:hypothetical protein
MKDYPPYLDYPKERKKQTNADKMRLIDADALKDMMLQAYNDALLEFDVPWKKKMAHSVTLSFMADIDEAPTVDAVPVVRCKDCKHRPYPNPNGSFGPSYVSDDEVCPYVCGDPYYNDVPADNSYCDRGERR